MNDKGISALDYAVKLERLASRYPESFRALYMQEPRVTWLGMLPMLVQYLESDRPGDRQLAMHHLEHMAQAADAFADSDRAVAALRPKP